MGAGLPWVQVMGSPHAYGISQFAQVGRHLQVELSHEEVLNIRL